VARPSDRCACFFCTGNSARSILGERLLARRGAGRFRSFSAGSRPQGQVHPLALRVLAEEGLPTEGLRSKSWEEFAASGAAPMDVVLTTCDGAAAEPCPIWPGAPVTAHWGVADPAAVEGDEATRLGAFRAAAAELDRRCAAFAALPLDALDAPALRRELARIGQGEAGAR